MISRRAQIARVNRALASLHQSIDGLGDLVDALPRGEELHAVASHARVVRARVDDILAACAPEPTPEPS